MTPDPGKSNWTSSLVQAHNSTTFDNHLNQPLEVYATHYAHTLDRLGQARTDLQKLGGSALKGRALEVVEELIHKIGFELQTLPQRIAAIKSATPVYLPWDSPRWTDPSFRSEVGQSLMSAVEWSHALRAMSVATGLAGILADIPVADAGDVVVSHPRLENESCATVFLNSDVTIDASLA